MPSYLTPDRIKSLAQIVGVGANTQLVAAIAGYRIRVFGWQLQGAGGVSVFTLKSNSAGTVIFPATTIPSGAAGLIDRLPIVESGYMETSTGHGLFCDVATSNLNLSLFYITYAPNS